MTKLTLECVDWRPLQRNTLAGFAAIRVPAMRLTVLDVALHSRGPSQWAALPSKPQLRDGAPVRDAASKIQYFPVFEFDTAEVRAAFSRAAVAAVLELHPNAFAETVTA